jgi:hypothetical protein
MSSPNFPSSNHRAQFIAARDSRNRRIPGLYVRRARYYAQLWVDLGNGKKAARRFPLRDGDNQPVRTLSAAREALEIKRHERRQNYLPILDANLSLQITSRPILRKQKYSARGLARWKMNARQSSAGAIISATCESIKSLRPPLPPTSTSG